MLNPLFEILGIALAVSFLTNYLRRRLMGPEEMAKMKEAQEFQRKLLQAQKKGDKKLIQKLKRKEEYYQKLTSQKYAILLIELYLIKKFQTSLMKNC